MMVARAWGGLRVDADVEEVSGTVKMVEHESAVTMLLLVLSPVEVAEDSR